MRQELADWLDGLHPGLAEWQTVLDRRIVRVRGWARPPLPVVPPLHPVPVEEPPPVAVTPAPAADPKPLRWSTPRGIARELLPPVVTRALRRVR